MSATVETLTGAAQGHASAAARALGTSAGDAGGSDAGQLPFALAIFVSAFLVFQVQLLLGKVILPLFGGAPAVWTVCIFVFQLLFLAGYGYSHGLATWLPLRKQVIAHSVLLGLSAVFIALAAYIRSAPHWLRRELATGGLERPHMGDHEIFDRRDRFAVLLAVGHESTDAALVRAGWAQAAALSALCAFKRGIAAGVTIVSVPGGTVRTTQHTTVGLGRGVRPVFGLLFFQRSKRGALGRSRSLKPEFVREPFWRARPTERRVGWPLRLLWMGLAACASVLLLATTNLVCQDIPVSPFLWVLQLGLYLLSFILCFESDRWYRREIFYPAFAVTVAFVILVSLPNVALFLHDAACRLFRGALHRVHGVSWRGGAHAPSPGIADCILFLHRHGRRLGGHRCEPAGSPDIPKLLGISAGSSGMHCGGAGRLDAGGFLVVVQGASFAGPRDFRRRGVGWRHP